MKKIKKILTNQQGFSTLVYSIAILNFIIVVTVAVIVNMQFQSLSLDIYDTASYSLDEYITVKAKENINSIKNGHDYILELDTDEYIEYLARNLGVNENLAGITANGREFLISNVSIEFVDISQMHLKVIFDLYMPIEVAGLSFAPLTATIYTDCEYQSKF